MIFSVKWVPQSLEIVEGIPQVGNTFSNSFFFPLPLLGHQSCSRGKLQLIRKTQTQKQEDIDNPK